MKPSYEDLYKALKVAEEALSVYAESKHYKDRELILGPFCEGDPLKPTQIFVKKDRGDIARRALYYIKPLLKEE